MKRIQLDWICSTCDLIRELGLSPSVERKVEKDAGDTDFTKHGMPSDAEDVHRSLNTEENVVLGKLGDVERIDVYKTLQVKNYDPIIKHLL